MCMPYELFLLQCKAFSCPQRKEHKMLAKILTNPFQEYFPSSLKDFIHSQNMATSVWKRYPLVKTSTHDLCTFQTTQATPSMPSPNLLPWSSSPPPWRTRTSGSSLMGSTSQRRPPLSRMRSRGALTNQVISGYQSLSLPWWRNKSTWDLSLW